MRIIKNIPAKLLPWNKDRLIGQKLPLTLKQIWAIRMSLQRAGKVRDLALFNLAIDSKLRACDLLQIKISDVCSEGLVNSRATVIQQKTRRPVKFEITDRTKRSIEKWIQTASLGVSDYLFPSRQKASAHLSMRQYTRTVASWVSGIGLDPALYGTHSMRRTKPTLIYRQTKNLRAVQLLLGHSKLDSTVQYLGIEIDDALEMSEQIDV